MMTSLDAAAVTVLSWLLTYAVHSTILLSIAVIAAWRFADHHAWLDHVWKAALVAPLLTASIQVDSFTIPIGARWEMPPAPIAIESSVSPVAPSPAASIEKTSEVREAAPQTLSAPVDRVTPVARVAPSWPLMIAAAWLLGALALLMRYAIKLQRVYRALGSGSPVTSDALLEQFPSIRLSTSDVCPVPLALSRSRIVLPQRFHDELDSEQQHAALAHEVAHVIRRDPEWRIAIEILERALFFQPLNRFARSRLYDSAEFLCDEWAVQHTQSPLALARCLSIVASWWSPADTLPAGVSAMARSESAMVRRVTRILDAPARIARPRALWLAIPIALVAVAAPRITAAQLPAPVASAVAAVLATTVTEKAEEQRDRQRDWTPAEVDAARAQLRVNRFESSGPTLKDRWFQALSDARKRGVNDFWMVYTFKTSVYGDDQILSDTREGTYISASGHITTDGPPLSAVISPNAVQLEGGNLAVLLHYRSATPDGLDRASYRSTSMGFAFGRTPVYWLGDVAADQSFERAQELFNISRDRRIQLWMIDLASLHPDANAVIPFLTRLVDPARPADIRNEAAEGFGHQHDPRSIEVLLRVARNDADSEVRAEAAETIGEVQTRESIPALHALINESPDFAVRTEAAEAFSSQPAAEAIPAIERVLATSADELVLNEAIEALGELGDPSALPILVNIANRHANFLVQEEAVETIGELGGPDAIAALERIAREHTNEDVQAEAIETISTGKGAGLHPLLLDLAISSRSARIRKEALDSIGEALHNISDAALLDRAQAVIERAVFEDPDRSVRVDAIDAIDHLPGDRAIRMLRDIIARHPDARVRKEAEEHVRERQ